jgi:hypothetical protein
MTCVFAPMTNLHRAVRHNKKPAANNREKNLRKKLKTFNFFMGLVHRNARVMLNNGLSDQQQHNRSR